MCTGGLFPKLNLKELKALVGALAWLFKMLQRWERGSFPRLSQQAVVERKFSKSCFSKDNQAHEGQYIHYNFFTIDFLHWHSQKPPREATKEAKEPQFPAFVPKLQNSSHCNLSTQNLGQSFTPQASATPQSTHNQVSTLLDLDYKVLGVFGLLAGHCKA